MLALTGCCHRLVKRERYTLQNDFTYENLISRVPTITMIWTFTNDNIFGITSTNKQN